MQANKRERPNMAVFWTCIRVSGWIGAEAVAAVMLRLLTSSGLEQGKSIVLDGRSGAQGLSLSRLVVVGASCLIWVAFSVLVGSTVGTLLLAALQRYAGHPRGLGWLAGPLWCRRAVVCACGLGLAAPMAASPSLAVGGVAKHPCSAVTRARTTKPGTLSGLPFPDLPDSGRPGTTPHVRVVRRGESLWLIAGSQLRPRASDAAIGRRVDALYALNRQAIGGDPDLILPGTPLIQPGGHL